MNNCTVTVILACHTAGDLADPVFPKQTIDPEHIQLLPVLEDDFYHPRRHSMELIARAEGDFIILLNKNDTFDEAFLEKMIQGASHADTAFSMASAGFQSVNRADEYFSVQPSEDVRPDTSAEASILPMELHGLMFPAALLKDAALKNLPSVEPEKQILLDILEKHPVFSYLASCSLHYAFAREYDYQYDLRCQTKEWYWDSLESFLLPYLEEQRRRHGSVPHLAQQLALHMLHIRMFANLNNRNKYVIPREEVPAYMDLFSHVFAYIDDGLIIASRPNYLLTLMQNVLFDLRLKRRDFSYYPEVRCEQKEFSLFCGEHKFAAFRRCQARINLMDYRDGALEIDGELDDFFSEEKSAVVAEFDGKRYPIVRNSRFAVSKCFGVTYNRMKTFHVSIPVPDSDKDRCLRFLFCMNGHEYALDYAFPSHTSRFAKEFSHAYWKFGHYLSFWKKDGIHVVPYRFHQMVMHELLTWRQMYKVKNGAYRNQLPLKILNFLLRPYFSRRKIWLFLDKIYKGGDSSEYIYKYAAKQKDGIRKYYLLDSGCADYKRMKKEGFQPLVRGSLKHRLVFLNADLVIASNSTVFAFNDYSFETSRPIRGDVHFGVACVQHGMSVQKIALAQQRLRDDTKLYFCASKYEIENLSKPVYDYVGYDALKLTGVPRYDGLKNRAEKILLFSPTWRMNSALPVSKNEGVARDYNPNFRETDYYRIYNSLINEPRLLEAARKYGYRIQYVLHPIVSPQAEDFTKNDFVEIIPATGDMSYEKLFCEAALMVTDYSGVQFDFAYMRKPVVYLHHEDIPQHYEEGTFHYTTMGFGEICKTNEELIDVLCSYMEHNCEMPEVYRKRADDFFEFSDHKNCERIYPIMLEYTR